MARKYTGLRNEQGRSIYVDYGNLSPKVKNVSTKTKRMLYENGRQGALHFFELRNNTKVSK